MARCACKQVCSCLITAGDCIVDPIPGTGALDNPYIISVEVVADGGVECTAGGLIANINTQDTDCVHFTGDGGLNPLMATIQLSPDTDNVLGPNFAGSGDSGCTANGFKLSCEDIQDCVGDAVQAFAGDCLLYDDADNTMNVEIADTPLTNGIKCTATGLEVIPSTDASNAIVFGTDGNFFSPLGGGVSFINDIDDDNCVNTTLTEGPIGTFAVESSIVIAPDADGPGGNGVTCTPTGLQVIPSTDAGNQVSFGTDGNLFVNVGAAGSITADNTDETCIDVVIGSTGPGTFTVAAHPNISAQPNTITCAADGLKSTVSHADSTCVQFGGDGSPSNPLFANMAVQTQNGNFPSCAGLAGNGCGDPLRVNLGFSPDACNGLQCRGNGLWAEAIPPIISNGQQGTCFAGLGIAPNFNRNPFGGTMTQTITNPSACRSMALTVTMEAREFDIQNKTGPGVFTINGELQINGGGFNVWGFTRSNTPGTYTLQVGTYNRFTLTIPPGGSATIDGKATVSSDGGAQSGTAGGCVILGLKGDYI